MILLCHWWEELIDNGHEFCDSPIILSRHNFQQPHCCVNTKLYHFLKLERKLLEVRACQALFLYNEYLQHRISPATVCFQVVDDKSRVENFSFLCFTENLRGFKSLHSSLNQIVTRVTFKGVSAPSLLLILPFCILYLALSLSDVVVVLPIYLLYEIDVTLDLKFVCVSLAHAQQPIQCLKADPPMAAIAV